MITSKGPKKAYYVDNAELERDWTQWNYDRDVMSWSRLSTGIYKICQGVAVKFNPRNDEEHAEYAHDALVLTLEKIRDGRLQFIPGKAPVFNLLTTTIFRHLYSRMNKDARRSRVMSNLRQKKLDEHQKE